jgi:hypothetical protein
MESQQFFIKVNFSLPIPIPDALARIYDTPERALYV